MINKITTLQRLIILLLILTTGCKLDLEKQIVLNAKNPNYIVQIYLNKNKDNKYFGVMHFTNLSKKNIEFLLVEEIFSKDRYKIFIEHQGVEYPFFNDTLASTMIVVPPKETRVYKVVLTNVFSDVDWDKANLRVSSSLFE